MYKSFFELNDEFECVKLTLKSSIKKLIVGDMKLHQVHDCFNMHMVTNVFFDVVFEGSIRNNVIN